MRDPKRISKFMTTIKDLWRLNPDLRFGQLIMNVIKEDEDLFYIEDNDLLERIINKYSNSEEINERLDNMLNYMKNDETK